MAHLLVLDDETSARTTLALLLRKRGHRVLEADGVTAATKCLAEEVFDLVVTDLRMPDGDASTCCGRQDPCPATEVILLTAYAEWKSAKEAHPPRGAGLFREGPGAGRALPPHRQGAGRPALRRENENLRASSASATGLAGPHRRSRPPCTRCWTRRARRPDLAPRLLIQGECRHGQGVIAKARAPRRPRAHARSWP